MTSVIHAVIKGTFLFLPIIRRKLRNACCKHVNLNAALPTNDDYQFLGKKEKEKTRKLLSCHFCISVGS